MLGPARKIYSLLNPLFSYVREFNIIVISVTVLIDAGRICLTGLQILSERICVTQIHSGNV